MKKLKIALTLSTLFSGCAAIIFPPIAADRTGYSDAWYYERLTPYYTNNMYFEPRVHLRAVKELVGVPTILVDGSQGHADIWRHDIELFFAERVPNAEDRLELVRAAIGITCPSTELTGVGDKIAYANQTYVVLHDVPCLGHAS